MNVYSSTIHCTQRVEMTHTSISWWMDEQTVVCPYSWTLFNHGKEWSADEHFHTDEPWRHITQKKPGARPYICECIPFILNVQSRQTNRTGSKLVVAGRGGIAEACRALAQSDGKLQTPHKEGCTEAGYTKHHLIAHFK